MATDPYCISIWQGEVKDNNDPRPQPAEALPAGRRRRQSERKDGRRDCSWDATQTKATYRIPVGLRAQLRIIAQNESLPTDDVARLALERFVADYQAGRVKFAKHPTSARFTLYPKSGDEVPQDEVP